MLQVKDMIKKWLPIIAISITVKLTIFIESFIFHPGNVDFLERWIRWDGSHYIDLAKNGYQATGEQALFIVFYPLYPLLIKIASIFINNYYLSSIFISTLFSFVASIALYELTLIQFNRKTAILSVLFLNIFPTAYFLQSPYTESTFLALSILTVYFFHLKKYVLSSITGFLSSLTRINGILLIPLLLLEDVPLKKKFLPVVSILSGFISYLTINYIVFNDFFYFTTPLSSNWFKHFEWPWQGIYNLIKSVPPVDNPDFYIYFSEVIALFFLLCISIFTYFRIKKSYGVYLFLNLLLFSSTSFILSTPRYLLCLFPIFISLARINSLMFKTFLLILFFCLLIYFTYFYINGIWAF